VEVLGLKNAIRWILSVSGAVSYAAEKDTNVSTNTSYNMQSKQYPACAGANRLLRKMWFAPDRGSSLVRAGRMQLAFAKRWLQ